MSVINQVLNQLERRGAHAALKQNMVRVVPQTRRNAFNLALTVAGVLLLVGLGLWLGWMRGHEANEGASAPRASDIPPLVALAPVSSVPALNDAIGPSGVPAVDMLAVEPMQEQGQPDSLLNIELNSASAVSPAVKSRSEARVKAAPRKESSQSQQATSPRIASSVAQTDVNMSLKQISRTQQADAEFRRGVALMRQGHNADAIASYEAALHLDAAHDAARQALVALLLESKRGLDAERVLQERLDGKPEHTGFAMLLARQQVDRGDVDMALVTLERSLSFADANAAYRAFFAALLQRKNRHAEAVAHYQAALKLQPDHGVWLMGYGISLQALQHDADAKAAFQRALDSRTLSPELQTFVQKRLKGS